MVPEIGAAFGVDGIENESPQRRQAIDKVGWWAVVEGGRGEKPERIGQDVMGVIRARAIETLFNDLEAGCGRIVQDPAAHDAGQNAVAERRRHQTLGIDAKDIGERCRRSDLWC